MHELTQEIRRVEAALRETKSPYLRNDYEKYLKKLYRKRRAASR